MSTGAPERQKKKSSAVGGSSRVASWSARSVGGMKCVCCAARDSTRLSSASLDGRSMTYRARRVSEALSAPSALSVPTSGPCRWCGARTMATRVAGCGPRSVRRYARFSAEQATTARPPAALPACRSTTAASSRSQGRRSSSVRGCPARSLAARQSSSRHPQAPNSARRQQHRGAGARRCCQAGGSRRPHRRWHACDSPGGGPQCSCRSLTGRP